MAQVKLRKCFIPVSPSNWVHMVFLTCDNQLGVWFKKGQKVKRIASHAPGAYHGVGGVPFFSCIYPSLQGEKAESLFELAQVWTYAGEWVHTFLYRKYGYKPVSVLLPCGQCNTTTTLSSSKNPANVGDSLTFTATVTNTDGSGTLGEAPEGTVTFTVDGSTVCTVTIPDDEPDSTNVRTATCNWSCSTQGSHAVAATFTSRTGDGLLSSSAGLTQTCNQPGVNTPCCPGNPTPTTLHATLSNATGTCGCLNGTTFTLTYDSVSQKWLGTFTVCGASQTSVQFFCQTPQDLWSVSGTGGCAFSQQTSPSPTCSPFSISFTSISEVTPNCCNGRFDLTVTQ